jgi:hypothetical protein
MSDRSVNKAHTGPKDVPFETAKERSGGECESACGRTDYPYDQEKVEQLKREWQAHLDKIKDAEAQK